ncbi:WD40 repeat domain-containing protein [Streptomyces sp. NBC_00343]|uniref:WD40 repeat domain-containing protein n=1 Tax=Streptomyces sp. NBC_00343 TaxID=2975719 RepID=UPI002E2D7623|nr:PQQ-binding-like beta-propeller repeat protein [Streptomyces sp. NBC_00343]
MTAEEMQALLEQMASTAVIGADDEWRQTWTYMIDDLMADGTVYDSAYAVLPHLVEAAAELPPEQSVDFWVDMGFIVTAEDRPPVPADLEAGFSAALRLAERAAARSLLDAGAPAKVCGRLALSCVAFAGHHIGAALRCLEPGESYLQLVCPGCGYDTELLTFFVDPVHPPFEAPELPDADHRARQGQHSWGEVADALQGDILGQEWEPFLRVARAVAAAGVPVGTPGPAVLCLVAGMVAAKGTPQWAGSEWARQLALLSDHFRCWNCEQTWTIADGLVENPDGARPQSVPAQASTDATDNSATAVRPAAVEPIGEATPRLRQDGNALLTADGTPWGRTTVFSDPAPGASGGVDSLTVVSLPDGPTLVAGGGVGAGDKGAVCLWDVADGRLVHGPLAGHPDRVRALTALPLAEGGVLLASGGDSGAIGLWDAVTGRPVREPVANWLGEVTGMCTAPLADGRTLLVTATSRGAVRLRDPDTGEPVGRLNPSGRPIRSLAAVPVTGGRTMIAAADTQGGVHMWDPAVDDPWDPGAAVQLKDRALSDGGHRVAAVSAVPTPDGTLLATADDRGVVMLWDPSTGTAVGEGLPPATGTAGLPVMAATTPHDGRTVLVTGTKRRHDLRVWEPATGTVRQISLDVAITCLAATGSDVIVGHDRGVVGVPLTRR